MQLARACLDESLAILESDSLSDMDIPQHEVEAKAKILASELRELAQWNWDLARLVREGFNLREKNL